MNKRVCIGLADKVTVKCWLTTKTVDCAWLGYWWASHYCSIQVECQVHAGPSAPTAWDFPKILGIWGRLGNWEFWCAIFGFLPARRYASAGTRDAMLARVIVIATCPSVCLSVTHRYCVKTKKASGMISSQSGSPKTLVFRRQISSPNSKGFPPNGGLKEGSVGKIQWFLALNVNISKTVADTAKVTISD